MKRNTTVLTRRERDILILGAEYLGYKHLSNAEIAQRLGVSVSSVKATIHRACVKLKARNRSEAVVLALKRGEISLSDLYSLEEIAERFRSLDPGMLRRIAYLVSQGLKHEHLMGKDEPIIRMDRRHDTILTKAERDVLILAGYSFTNREIADRLCISISSVRTFLYRACTKLGAHKRATAVLVALKRGEISASDIFSPDELIRVFAPLGAESIEKVAQLVDQKLGQELTPTGS